MVSEAEVCCTKTVSSPARTLARSSQAVIWGVISYRPLPWVATCRRWEVICMGFRRWDRPSHLVVCRASPNCRIDERQKAIVCPTYVPSAAQSLTGVEGAHGEREDRLEEGAEYLPHEQQADHAEDAERAAEILDATRQVFGDQHAERAEAIQRRHRNQIERAQQQVEREHQAHQAHEHPPPGRAPGGRRFHHVHE